MRKNLLILVFCLVSKISWAQPVINSFSPTSGVSGTEVIISGSNFSSTATENIVFFGAAKASVLSASTNSLVVTVPTGATYYPITVSTNNLTAFSDKPFIVTFTGGGFDFTPASFANQVTFPSGAWPYSFCTTDIDGDSKVDVVCSNYSAATLSYIKNISTTGTVSFEPKTDYPTGTVNMMVAAADFNSDGLPDLVNTNWDNSNVHVFKNTTSGGVVSFAPYFAVATGLNPNSVTSGDIDGDGRVDMIVGNVNGFTISVLRNTSTGNNISFAPAINFPRGTGYSSIIVRDLDNDDKPDIAVASAGSNIVGLFRNTSTPGNISLAARVDLTTANAPWSIDVGDLDDDGLPDLATTNNQTNSMSVFRNTSTPGTLSFATKVDYFLGSFPQRISIADLNGDGKLDIAANAGDASFNQLLCLYKNVSTPGNITMQSKVDIITNSNNLWLKVADVDGDGKPDVITSSNPANVISVFRNTFTTIPVTFISISAKITHKKSLIVWETATEQNTASFIVQHSIDGIHFNDIGVVPASGNSNTLKKYSFIHNLPVIGYNYYRTKQLDIDRNYQMSTIVKVEFISGEYDISIYPNPASGSIIIRHPAVFSSQLLITDQDGKTIRMIDVQNYSTSTKIDLSVLPAGLYDVIWFNRQPRHHKKLVVIH